MNYKNTASVLFSIFLFFSVNVSAQGMRPCELRFYVDSNLNTTTTISYNSNGDVLKMTSFENGKLADYAKYHYSSSGKLLSEKTYDSSNILLRTRYYFYDDKNLITGEKVFSPSGRLTEYLVLSYNGRMISKIEYFRPDDILYQTIDFRYIDDRLDIMAFNKIGKYVMIMKTVYDKNMLLTGHSITHSNADIKIETRYIYEEGNATDEALQLIFR